MTRFYPAIHDPVVKHLFHCTMDDEQIADRIGVSSQTIRRARERLGLGYPSKAPIAGAPPEIPPRSSDPNNPMVIAFGTLGSRLSEMNGCYRLDGTPTNFFDLMKETNRVRAKLGRPQIGPDAWRTKP